MQVSANGALILYCLYCTCMCALQVHVRLYNEELGTHFARPPDVKVFDSVWHIIQMMYICICYWSI